MTEQGELFDPLEGVRLRDAGMALAQTPEWATPEWKAAAFGMIEQVARQQAMFTSADVRVALGRNAPPKGSKILGPLMRQAAVAGLISGPVGTQRSDRPTHHRGIEYVWRSNLYEDDGSDTQG